MEVPELTIEVASRPEASDILISPQRCAQITCLVSIGDSQDELPAGYDNVPHKLRLLVADVVTELGATEEDILQILRLAEGLRSATGTILIHCEAGVSRSSAAALIMYAYWFGPRARAGGDGEGAIATSGRDPEPPNDSDLERQPLMIMAPHLRSCSAGTTAPDPDSGRASRECS